MSFTFRISEINDRISRLMVLFLLLSLALASDRRFLAVVGRCDETSCRILYESSRPLVLRVGSLPDRILTPTSGVPNVAIVSSLRPGHKYAGSIEEVPLTLVTAGGSRDRVAFVSCNRGYEDRDFGFYKQLEKTERDLTVHLGDQIYADWLVWSLKGNETEDELVERIRNVYRETWRPITAALLSSPSESVFPCLFF
jgi:hypothetical protein